MSVMGLKAIGFDIDGTLYPDIRAWRHSVLFYLSNRRIISAFARTRKLMRNTGKDSETDEANFFAEQLNSTIAIARKTRDNVIYKGWEKCFRKVKVYKGVREALLRLKAADLKLGVLSDFPVGLKLHYFGLDDIFDTVLGYPDSGRLKPNPEPFYKMANQLGVDPPDILYIGNRLSIDFTGAENAGLQGVLIGKRGNGKNRIPSEVSVFSNYQQLTDWLYWEVQNDF